MADKGNENVSTDPSPEELIRRLLETGAVQTRPSPVQTTENAEPIAPPNSPINVSPASEEPTTTTVETQTPKEPTCPSTSKNDQVTNIVLRDILDQISTHFQQLSAKTAEQENPTENEPLLGDLLNAPSVEEWTKEQIEARPPKSATTTTTTSKEVTKSKVEDQKPRIDLRLDKIQLVTFDGDLTNCISFRDQFLDLVHNNPNLTAITKFHQLKTPLRGLALDSINGFKLSAVDYETAWSLILSRYNKKKKIIEEYIKKFTELPPLNPEPTSTQLINMVNRTNQLFRVLPNLGVNVDSWDSWIIYTVKSKLDRFTLRKWLDQAKRRENIPLSEVR